MAHVEEGDIVQTNVREEGEGSRFYRGADTAKVEHTFFDKGMGWHALISWAVDEDPKEPYSLDNPPVLETWIVPFKYLEKAM